MDTRKSLEDEVLGWLDESGDTSTTQANVRAAIKQAHIARLTQFDWPFLTWAEPKTLSITPGRRLYTLHSEYWKPLYFRSITRERTLREKPFEKYQPGQDEQDRFVLWNRSPVARQTEYPGGATLTIVSLSALDTGASRGVRIRFEEPSYGSVVTETIVPNGTTPVQATHLFSPGGILQLSKFGVWSGALIVTSSVGVTNIVLEPEENAKSYQQIRLLYEPTEAETIEYLFFRSPNPLNYPEDVPDIPYPHSGILVWDALKLLYAYDGQLDSARLAVIQDNIDRMDTAMRQSFIEGQSLLAETPEIHDIEED